MLHKNRSTLTQFLIEERRRFPQASGGFNDLILNIAISCKRIARAVAQGRLGEAAGNAGGAVNVQGEEQKHLDVVSNDFFLRMHNGSNCLAGMASEEMETAHCFDESPAGGAYLLAYDPLDGSSNLDVNCSVGTIFSILRAPAEDRKACDADFLQPGAQQVAAGYAVYGPATMFVLSVGRGVHGFTLDPNLGEFTLTHPDIRIAPDTHEFAINASNARFWEAPVRRYVDECLAGEAGVRGKDFNMRWIAALVAEAHRILMRGGVFLYPRDSREPDANGRLRLLYEANPIGFLIEQAGGRASTGRRPVLGVQPSALHQRIGFIFGAKNEVERIERYHSSDADSDLSQQLFNERSLFRVAN